MWISVKDRLPVRGVLVDVWRHDRGRIADCRLHSEPGELINGPGFIQWNMRCGRFAGGADITHWMPIPLVGSQGDPNAQARPIDLAKEGP